MPTPAPNTASLLHHLVSVWREIVVALHREGELASFHLTGALTHDVLARGGHLELLPPWDTRPLTPILQRLLDEDPYLRATCITPFYLARALEMVLDANIQVVLAEGEKLDAPLVGHVLKQLYKADYRRKLYIRLYNVVVEDPPVDLEAVSAVIEVLQQHQIPTITGETTHYSRLHHPGTGDSFIMFSDDGSGDDVEWWQQKWAVAVPIVQVLKYVKYAVVGLWGDAIRAGVGKSCSSSRDWYWRTAENRHTRPTVPSYCRRDERRLRRYIALMKQHEALLTDLKPTLRQSLLTAGDYYEGHHGRAGLPDKLIDLVIALEALFGDRRSELGLTVSLATATLLGDTTAEMANLLSFVRRMYNARSGLVHGAQNPFATTAKEKTRVSAADVARLGDLVRQAIVRLAVLLVHGDYKRQREPFLADLSRAVFDADLRAKIRTLTDVEQLLGPERLLGPE